MKKFQLRNYKKIKKKVNKNLTQSQNSKPQMIQIQTGNKLTKVKIFQK